MRMSKQEKKGLVPERRFPEFQDAKEWVRKPLCEIGEILQGYGFPEVFQGKTQGEYPFYKVSDISNTILNGSHFIDKAVNYIDRDDLALIRAKTIPAGTTVFAKIGEAIRSNRRALTSSECLIDNNVAGVKAIHGKANDLYIFYVLSQINLIEYSGGAVPSVNKSTLENIPVFSTQPEEQQKVADCLASIDELITAESQKLETLKTHKKGLMQQLFPAEGETIPTLRFPEFRKTGEWKPMPVGEKVELVSGYPFKSTEISEDPSGIPLMRGINITEGFVRHNKEIDRFYLGKTNGLEKYLLRESDLIIGMDGSKVGKNSALITDFDAGSLLIQRVARLRSDCSSTISFIFQHINSNRFHSYVDRINTSGGIPHISAKQISDFVICFPRDKKEQKKVADSLIFLDDLIRAQAQNLDVLKAHKKSLMQQLFPAMDGVEA